MRKIGKFTVFILLLFVTKLQINAQSYPVQIIPQVASPPPVYLSDYSSVNNNTDLVKVQLLLTDLTVINREIRLKLYIEGNGINALSRDFVIGSQPIFLDGGIPLELNSFELASYFDLQNLEGISAGTYANALPEGLYQFCFEAFDVLSGNRISDKSCTNVLIFLNDPPFLNFPENNVNIHAIDPQNIIFQWTPRNINVSNVQYEFSLVEVWDNNMDPQAIFLSSPPIYQTTSQATSLLYGLTEPQLLEGKHYAWRVKAKALNGFDEIGLFKNNGYSEIFTFTYQADCPEPYELTVEEVGTNTATFRWQADFKNVEYKIGYRKAIDKNGNTDDSNTNHWFENTTIHEEFTVLDLEPNTMYEWRVAGICEDGTLSFTDSVIFHTMSEEVEAYYNCGIEPIIDITNQTLLDHLQKGDVIKAGDFKVKISEVNGNGSFSGKGYTTVGLLKNLKIAIEFTDIKVNTDYQLVFGEINSVYDPTWSNTLDIDEAIDEFADVADAAADLQNILDEVFGEEKEEENNTEISSGGMGSSSTETSPNDNSTSESGSSNNSEDNTSDNNTSNSEDSNESENNTSDQSSDSDETDSATDIDEIVIIYNGKDYKDGDKIEVPFKENQSNFIFSLKNYPENSIIKWNIFYGDIENTPDFAVTETDKDSIGIDMKSKLFLELEANYNDKKIKAIIERKPKEFKLINLYAKPKGNIKRLAKTGEKLYLLKTPDGKKIDYGVHISPKLYQNEISVYDISWNYNAFNSENEPEKYYGKKNIQRNLKISDKKIVTAVDAGYPFKKEKSIDVVWFDKNKRDYSFIPSEVIELIKNTFQGFDDNLKLIEKYIPKAGERFKIEPIEFIGSRYNEEHQNSRLYKQVEVGYIKGSISANLKKLEFTHPILKGLSKARIADVGLYTKFSFSIGASGGVERYKFIEHTKFENDSPFFKITPSGCIYVGIEAKLLVAKESVDFNVDGHVRTCIEGKIKYLFNETRLTGKIYIPPIVLGAKVKIGTKGTLEFDLINWKDKISITDEIPIGEAEHQF